MTIRTEVHDRVLNAESTDELMGVYQDWAAQYDKDLTENWGYPTPDHVARLVDKYVTNKTAKCLDAGCGTGLVGLALNKRGFSDISGADYNAAMLAEANNKNVYGDLLQIDLNEILPFADETYDLVTCAGTFTAAHVRPHAIRELVRITKSGGYLCFTVRDTYWSETNFAALLLELDQARVASLQEIRTEQYIESEQSLCKVVLLKAL